MTNKNTAAQKATTTATTVESGALTAMATSAGITMEPVLLALLTSVIINFLMLGYTLFYSDSGVMNSSNINSQFFMNLKSLSLSDDNAKKIIINEPEKFYIGAFIFQKLIVDVIPKSDAALQYNAEEYNTALQEAQDKLKTKLKTEPKEEATKSREEVVTERVKALNKIPNHFGEHFLMAKPTADDRRLSNSRIKYYNLVTSQRHVADFMALVIKAVNAASQATST